MAVSPVSKATPAQAVQLVAIRSLFAVLERTAPAVGGRLAERIWCAIPRKHPAGACPPGRRFEVAGPTGRIVAEEWGAGPRTVYLMHGWGGRRTDLGDFVAPLADSGFRVVALDAPGHGDSDPGPFGPGRGLLTDLIGALGAVVADCGPAYAVIAHSLGGCATGVAVADGLATERLVTIGAPSELEPHVAVFARTLGMGPRCLARFRTGLEGRLGRPMTDFTLPDRFADRAPETLPVTLLIHDHQDKEVPYTEALTLQRALPDVRLIGTTGYGHRRILRRPEVVARVLDFLAESRQQQPAAPGRHADSAP
ncbi:alpha/beta fold hydrolase [Catellatospora sp. IY07-71]|uniref:alpha/beta fold hydrolase n=1 Tax=Catellatospora sp. IY07-71 TaxID=2728827 RepID=UPI001BB33F59|nr:alpha/beta hydrolase [Catellatospora sp. IY07-71]